MAKDFNIYQWRRNHLNEEHKNPSLKGAMEEWFGDSIPTKEEMMGFIEWFYNQGTGEPNMIGLNEDLEIGNEYTKTDLSKIFDKIYWKGSKVIKPSELPIDNVMYLGSYQGLPNFVTPKGSEPKFTMPEDPEAIRAATRTSTNPRGTVS